MLTDCRTEPSKGPFAWSLHHPLSRQMSTCAGWCCAGPSSPGCSTDTLGHSRYSQGGIIVFLGVRQGLMEDRTLGEKFISLWASFFHSFTQQYLQHPPHSRHWGWCQARSDK